MTYGVDQCRRCGRCMPLSDPEALARHEAASKRKPIMAEAEWRRAGWLASPTPYQMIHPLDGVCFDCKFHLGSRRRSSPRLLAIIAVAAATVGLLIYVIALMLP